MTLVPLPTLVFPIPFPLFWREQIDHPEKLGTIRFSLPHPFDSTVHAKSAPTSRLPTIASIAANRWWENHIAGACPPKYNRFSRRREFRSGFFSDRRADVRVPVWVWGAGAQSQPIVRLSAHVSYSYFHFTLADHVFEIACTDIFLQLLSTSTLLLTPYTTESPSAAGIHPHDARRCGETSGCFPLCSSLAPGRRTAPESCRLPSPADSAPRRSCR